jgi:hypothetical protein
MAETAGDIIGDALTDLVVQDAEASLEASEYQVGIRYLNRMMFRLDAMGINLGYTEVTNLSDPITVALGAMDGIVANLAIALAPQFDAIVTAGINSRAIDGLNAMRKLSRNMQPTSPPCTLPIGSGNEWDNYSNDHFYPCLDDNSILTETDRNILLEDATE